MQSEEDDQRWTSRIKKKVLKGLKELALHYNGSQNGDLKERGTFTVYKINFYFYFAPIKKARQSSCRF